MYRVFGTKCIKENLYIKKGEYTDVFVKNRYSSIEHYTVYMKDKYGYNMYNTVCIECLEISI